MCMIEFCLSIPAAHFGNTSSLQSEHHTKHVAIQVKHVNWHNRFSLIVTILCASTILVQCINIDWINKLPIITINHGYLHQANRCLCLWKCYRHFLTLIWTLTCNLSIISAAVHTLNANDSPRLSKIIKNKDYCNSVNMILCVVLYILIKCVTKSLLLVF